MYKSTRKHLLIKLNIPPKINKSVIKEQTVVKVYTSELNTRALYYKYNISSNNYYYYKL